VAIQMKNKIKDIFDDFQAYFPFLFWSTFSKDRKRWKKLYKGKINLPRGRE
jgi:hypothetical protein